MGIENSELRCSVCGKLASEDCAFNKKRMMCNRHNLQMLRHGKILSKEEIYSRNYDKVCDVCGDDKSDDYYMWHKDGEYKNKVLCRKHYSQLKKHGKLLDDMPSLYDDDEKVCCVCGSDYKVHYSRLFKGLYCQRHYSQLYNLGELKERTVFDRNDYVVDDHVTYIIIRNKKQEEVARATIDTEDLEIVKPYKWNVGSWGYAHTNINGKNILMQRLILNEFDKNKIPDHINRNTLDNRKSNLRIVDKSLNAVNAGIRPNNTSGVTGVSWDKNANSWRAYINYQGKRIELGHRKQFNDAVVLRLIAENKYYAGMQPQKEIFKKYGVELYE